MSHLTTEQRYTISVIIAQGESPTNIARNGDQKNGKYRFELAVKKARERQESKTRHVHFTTEMQIRVDNLLRLDYSPEQVKGFCKSEGITCVSHERIYQHVWDDKKKGVICTSI